jgi:DNA-binding GntR family transcriptional regulator
MSPVTYKSPKTLTPPRSMADQVYEHLKSEIFTAKIPAAQRLYEKEVAVAYAVSRTPVREAFRRLEQDCLVERVAQGGVRVSEISARSLDDLFSLRAVLEAHAMELACERITPDELLGLRGIQSRAGEVLGMLEDNRQYALERLIELNSEFHEAIYSATKNPLLIRMLNNMCGMVKGLRAVSIQAGQACQMAWEDHGRLINCLKSGDKPAARELIRRHIRDAQDQALSVLQEAGQ